MKKACMGRMGWLGACLLGAVAAGAQPEEPPDPRREAPELRELKGALEQREDALAEARRRLEEMERRLREERMRSLGESLRPGPEARMIRVFPLTPALQGAGTALEPLTKLPETLFLVVPGNLVVGGPAPAVEAITRVLTTLDPTLQPQPVTLMARVYLAAEALPPNLMAPQEDPLLEQVRERTGYTQVGLLTKLDLPGQEGEPLNTESEMGIKGDWGELHGTLRLMVAPQILGKQQVQMRVHFNLELMLGPGGFRRLQHEGTLLTAPGQAVLVVSADPISQSALVLALAPFVGG